MKTLKTISYIFGTGGYGGSFPTLVFGRDVKLDFVSVFIYLKTRTGNVYENYSKHYLFLFDFMELLIF